MRRDAALDDAPPRLYGGTERIVAYLADAQVGLGHDVTVFASGDSRTRARLLPCRAQALRLDAEPLKSDIAAHLAMLHEVRRRADEFDLPSARDPSPERGFVDEARVERGRSARRGLHCVEDPPGDVVVGHDPNGLVRDQALIALRRL